VQLASVIALFFHLLFVLTLVRIGAQPALPPFVYLAGFVPVAILATATQGNLFGTDRGSTITALTAAVRARTYCRLRLVTSFMWGLVILLAGWIVGVTAMGIRFLPLALLQLALFVILSATGAVLSVLSPSSRSYDRATAQTMSVTALAALNVVSIVFILASTKLLSSVPDFSARMSVAIVSAAIAVAAEIAAVFWIGDLFESRRDTMIDTLRENP
jgi:hypothetical protein